MEKILERARRNLNRILDIQYETEDLLRKKDYKALHLLTRMAEACADEMKTLLESGAGEKDIIHGLQSAVDNFFGPRKAPEQTIELASFLTDKIQDLKPELDSRKCTLTTAFEKTAPVVIPSQVLDMIVTGLIRNSLEYTPDHGRIQLVLKTKDNCPEFFVKDTGVGFTKEKILLIFEKYFTPPESADYGTKTPFAFNAGGNGFDLLRMQIFSEKYDFKLSIDSKRCRFIPRDQDICPGDIFDCPHCTKPGDCFESGGTCVSIRFSLPGRPLKSGRPPDSLA